MLVDCSLAPLPFAGFRGADHFFFFFVHEIFLDAHPLAHWGVLLKAISSVAALGTICAHVELRALAPAMHPEVAYVVTRPHR
jgi:hypothetical protein